MSGLQPPLHMAFLGDRGGGPRLWDHGPPSLRLYFVISRRPEGQPPILSPSEELSWDFRTGARSPRAPPSAPRLSLTSLSDDPRTAENARGSSGRLRAAWFMGPPPHGAPSQEHRRAVPTTQDADSPSRKGPGPQPTSCRAPRACSLPASCFRTEGEGPCYVVIAFPGLLCSKWNTQ